MFTLTMLNRAETALSQVLSALFPSLPNSPQQAAGRSSIQAAPKGSLYPDYPILRPRIRVTSSPCCHTLHLIIPLPASSCRGHPPPIEERMASRHAPSNHPRHISTSSEGFCTNSDTGLPQTTTWAQVHPSLHVMMPPVNKQPHTQKSSQWCYLSKKNWDCPI